MAETSSNPLISMKPPETSLFVSLHPIVLLTASDLITRHRLRHESAPPAGILLGQQKGQETTVEHAFPTKLLGVGHAQWDLAEQWTETRVQQYKDVHKAPALDAVGWFTTCPPSGPTWEHARIQQQFNTLFGESGLFLAIHPTELNVSDTTNRKLPLTIYESVAETDGAPDDGTMQVDGDDIIKTRFREVPYTVDTEETEMIAINYVAKGAGSAAAIETTPAATAKEEKPNEKGKGRADGKVTDDSSDKANTLTSEEEDQVAGISTRVNSVRMLQTRLGSIIAFLRSLPPSYLSDPSTPITELTPSLEHIPHLRNVQALITRLSLLTPASEQPQIPSALNAAQQSQRNDVNLISILSQLGHDVQSLNELGRKFATVESTKSARGKGKAIFNSGAYGSHDGLDGERPGLAMSQGGGAMML